MNKNKIKDNIKKLLGIRPYDGSTNFVRNDCYFGKSIRDDCRSNGFDYDKLLKEVQDEK